MSSRYYTVAILLYRRRANLCEFYVFRTHCLDHHFFLTQMPRPFTLDTPAVVVTGDHLICIALLRGSGT